MASRGNIAENKKTPTQFAVSLLGLPTRIAHEGATAISATPSKRAEAYPARTQVDVRTPRSSVQSRDRNHGKSSFRPRALAVTLRAQLGASVRRDDRTALPRTRL